MRKAWCDKVPFFLKSIWRCEKCGWMNMSRDAGCTACKTLKEVKNIVKDLEPEDVILNQEEHHEQKLYI